MEHTSTATALAVAAGLSKNVDSGLAAEQVVEQVAASIRPGNADLAFIFASGRHAAALDEIANVVRSTLEPGTLLGVSAEGIVGGVNETERQTGLSILVASLPGTSLHPFQYRELPHVKPGDLTALKQAADVVGARRDLRGVVFFADPFSVPAAAAVGVLSDLRLAVDGLRRVPVIGGMASAAPRPGGNILVLNDQVSRAGGIGVAIRGDIEITSVVSQGCRPIGRPLVITAAQRNLIRTLAGKRAIDVLREIVSDLSEQDRALLPNGVLIGRVIDEYKPRFGRGDFLIRGVLGVDQPSGAIAVSELVKTGQTVQFHLRDSQTAAEDLQLLLAAQQLQHPPAGGLLCTCNGRGTRLFSEPNHDAAAVVAALSESPDRPLPLAGFFAAGEIGPVGDESFLHGHTASLALFRPRRRVHGSD